MAVRTTTMRLAVDGETSFKKAMAEINASLRATRSEMELSLSLIHISEPTRPY